jgi:hypothetical protein
MNRRSLFGFLAVAPIALPAAVAAIEAGRGGATTKFVMQKLTIRREAGHGVVYLDGDRVADAMTEMLARESKTRRFEGSAYVRT